MNRFKTIVEKVIAGSKVSDAVATLSETTTLPPFHNPPERRPNGNRGGLSLSISKSSAAGGSTPPYPPPHYDDSWYSPEKDCKDCGRDKNKKPETHLPGYPLIKMHPKDWCSSCGKSEWDDMRDEINKAHIDNIKGRKSIPKPR